MNIVKITASGKVGCGKSAVLGEIEIALRAIGIEVQWDEGDAEKNLTHADWIPELEMYKPTVVLCEKIERAAPVAQQDAIDAARYRWVKENVLTGSIGFGDWWITSDDIPDELDTAIDAARATKEAS